MKEFLVEYSYLISIILAIILGFVLGLERELTNKWAGLRTNILVCLGSCVFTILSIKGFPPNAISEYSVRVGDPARIAAQVLTGIGFIGGGTVLRHGTSIFGLTTAATLWIAAAIGMACGCGLYKIAIFSTILAVGVLVFIRILEKKCFPNNYKNIKRYEISVTCPSIDADDVKDYIVEKFHEIIELKRKKSDKADDLSKINVVVDLKEQFDVKTIYSEFLTLKNIDAISIREVNE